MLGGPVCCPPAQILEGTCSPHPSPPGSPPMAFIFAFWPLHRLLRTFLARALVASKSTQWACVAFSWIEINLINTYIGIVYCVLCVVIMLYVHTRLWNRAVFCLSN